MGGAPAPKEPGSGGRAASTGGAAGAAGDLVLRYEFEETEGYLAADSSGYAGGPRNAVLRTAGSGGSSGFSSDHRVGSRALALVSGGTTSGGYVTTPAIGELAPQAATIALWVKMTSTAQWQRVFDYGENSDRYLFLTTGDESSFVRFAITSGGALAEERITSNVRLQAGSWHHVAVVLDAGKPYRGTLYLDGAVVGTNASMTLHPGDLGSTNSNYLGRSQFENDPIFNGLLDDYRVYRRPLTATEVAALAKP
jgi:hypothetical protein